MHIDVLMPSKHLRAADFQGQDATLVIANYMQEEVGSKKEQKLVLYFRGVPKGMVLNRTNANRIAAIYGTEVDHWIGQSITLFPTTTDMAGKMVECIRVREQMPMLGRPTQQQPQQQPANQAAVFGGGMMSAMPLGQQLPTMGAATVVPSPLLQQPAAQPAMQSAVPGMPQITPEMMAAVQSMLAQQVPQAPQLGAQGNAAVGGAAGPTFQGSVS